MPTSRTHPNHLAGPYLDRVAQLRKDEAQLRAALANPATLFVPVWRTRSFINTGAAASVQTLTAQFVVAEEPLGVIDPSELILLGEFRGQVCFAIEIESAEAPLLRPYAEFRDLRSIAGELPRDEAGLLAYARAMVLWRERHRFCGRCGSASLAAQAGHVRVCSNPACANQQFPRIDPAVIVLITDGERALLGRQAAWLAGRYSTIAGFVEPGESLEDAVVREVREETGVEVDAVDYHSSQPWPFPASLMLGFTAHAATTAIRLIDAELEDARWWTRAEIAAGAVSLPTPYSISFRLIEDWYDAGAVTPLRDEPRTWLWNSPPR